MTKQTIRGIERFESAGRTECQSGPALDGRSSPDDVAEFTAFSGNWDSEYAHWTIICTDPNVSSFPKVIS